MAGKLPTPNLDGNETNKRRSKSQKNRDRIKRQQQRLKEEALSQTTTSPQQPKNKLPEDLKQPKKMQSESQQPTKQPQKSEHPRDVKTEAGDLSNSQHGHEDKEYTTSFWGSRRTDSERKDPPSGGGGAGAGGGGGAGGNDSDDCDNKWAEDIVCDQSWWDHYVPPEPSREEIFAVHTPGPKLQGFDETQVPKLSGPKPNNYEPFMSFEDASLPSAVLDNIRESEYSQPTPVQKYALPPLFAGRDMMVCAPTGSGKTAAYLIPIISNLLRMGNKLPGREELASPLALILLPTQDLARQIYVQALKLTYGTGVHVARVYGQCNHKVQVDKLQLDLNEVDTGCHIIIATPGRLRTFVFGSKIRNPEVSLKKVKYFVLDECDHMLVRYKSVFKKRPSKEGPGAESFAKSGFYHDVYGLVNFSSGMVTDTSDTDTNTDIDTEVRPDMPSVKYRQTMMFSASLPKYFQFCAKEFLKADYLHLLVKSGAASTCINVTQVVYPVAAKDKWPTLLKVLRAELQDEHKRVLIFTRYKHKQEDELAHASVPDIVELLTNEGFKATGISSGRVQEDREESLRLFRWDLPEGEEENSNEGGSMDGPKNIIVATAVGSRGLDIEGVDLVINYDLPDMEYVGIEEYVHKIGRTGRIGNQGKAISFFDEACDIEIARSLRLELREWVPEWLDKLCESRVAFGTKDDQRFLDSRDVRYPR